MVTADELEMPVECISGGHRVTITFDDIAKFLPAVRCYRTIDELGHNMYKLQCYFITHFLYVMSDWGQHSLRRELFAEEFHFIIANFQQALRLSDPELVGEFIQCLQHFGVCASTDPKLWHLMEEGRAFLLDLELKNGSRGLWVALRASIYDRYHSSYCAAVGLMDSTKYDYLARKEQPPIPIPFRDPTATMAPSSTPSEEDASGKETLVLHEEHDKEEIEVAVVRAEATTTAKSRKRSAAAAAVAQQQDNAHQRSRARAHEQPYDRRGECSHRNDELHPAGKAAAKGGAESGGDHVAEHPRPQAGHLHGRRGETGRQGRHACGSSSSFGVGAEQWKRRIIATDWPHDADDQRRRRRGVDRRWASRRAAS